MTATPTAHMHNATYRLGNLTPVDEADPDVLAKQELQALRSKGLRTFSLLDRPLADVIGECIESTLAGWDRADIDAVLFVTESFSQLPIAGIARAETPFGGMRNALLQMCVGLGIRNARYFAASFGGSSNFLQALFLAKPLVESGGVRNLLVVCADRQPPRLSRLMADAGAIVGDGVAACVLSADPAPSQASWKIEHVGITPSMNLAQRRAAGLAGLDAYRGTRAAAEEAYRAVGRRPDEFGWLILNNYNPASSRAFAALLGFKQERVFVANVGRTGHIPACDSLINLRDLTESTPMGPGARVLIFVVGPVSFGAISLVRAHAVDPG